MNMKELFDKIKFNLIKYAELIIMMLFMIMVLVLLFG
jgi:hypothetical protein